MRKNDLGLYIGLMSGTSCDGIDASIIKTNGDNIFEPVKDLHRPYSDDFKHRLLKLMQDHNNFLNIEVELSELHAWAVNDLLQAAKLKALDITAIGFHGQTIIHRPKENICWQIGNPHLLKSQTNIDVVYDFRRKDISLGGQGAPLIPIFHKCLVGEVAEPVALINIGGVANITYISPQDLIAFDTGPGNALIDDATQKYFQQKFDDNGKIAKSGKVDNAKIQQFMKDKYFSQNYPKSLDRNYFHYVLTSLSLLPKEDIIASLTYFTAYCIYLAIKNLPEMPKQIYLCGGGAKNHTLINFLQDLYPDKIDPISKINQRLDIDFIESQGFAYLAARRLNKLPSSFPTTTGVRLPSISGILVN